MTGKTTFWPFSLGAVLVCELASTASANLATIGPLFHKAIRIDTDKKTQEWITHIRSLKAENIHLGGVLYVPAMVRAVQIQDGKAAAGRASTPSW